MHVAGKMQVDVFHRQDLGVTTAGSTAFDAEDRSQGRFAQGDDGFMTHVVQGLGQADSRQGLAFAGRVGVMAVTRTSFPSSFFERR